MKASVFAALLAALLSLPAIASDKPEPAVNADNKESFATVSGWVHKEMTTGGRYEHLTSSERSTVDAKLTEMGELLEKHGSVASMNDNEKTTMFNSQEQVNAILAKRDGDRMICKSVAPVGSHIPVKTCKTAREMEQDQKNVRQFMDDRGQITQKQGGGGGP